MNKLVTVSVRYGEQMVEATGLSVYEAVYKLQQKYGWTHAISQTDIVVHDRLFVCL